MDLLTKEMGEDHYLTTLLLEQGFNCIHHAEVTVQSFAPNNLLEFIAQRRRWCANEIGNHFYSIISPALWRLQKGRCVLHARR
jgi:cellulose synthase/poly-beta-1,6-N-acetylglucosamine synthase-like glycosyltransferase